MTAFIGYLDLLSHLLSVSTESITDYSVNHDVSVTLILHGQNTQGMSKERLVSLV